jgi:hypothetical protein
VAILVGHELPRLPVSSQQRYPIAPIRQYERNRTGPAASSAGYASRFSNHCVIAVREYLDRFRQPILQATPVAAVNGLAPKFDGPPGARGLALYEALQRFDRQCGYPMAWFFHMLTTKAVPHTVAYAVVDDVQAGFSYLPARDVKIVKDWLHRPYSF